MEVGFTKAQSDNLPRVDGIMVATFFKNNPLFTSPEIRGMKTASAAREQYGDEAIGYVQLKRENRKCLIKCKICPEHKVRSKLYNVSMVVDEAEEIIDEVHCQDCAASEGGCKHAVAFLMWVHRRSEEPASTSIKNYWKKSSLSKVGTSTKFMKVTDFGPLRQKLEIPSQCFAKFVSTVKQQDVNCQLIKHLDSYEVPSRQKLSLHQLMLDFVGQRGSDCEAFSSFWRSNLSASAIAEVESATKLQSKDELWFQLRYGRITASRAYGVSRCQTAEGTLMLSVMGAYNIPDTTGMKRGRLLESEVLNNLKREVNTNINTSGLWISQEYPFIAASPDGIADNFIVEIKCPTSCKSITNYIVDNQISAKCKAQVQLQMFVANKETALFCVADPKYEENRKSTSLWIQYDRDYVNELIPRLEAFWKTHIFPKLLSSVTL